MGNTRSKSTKKCEEKTENQSLIGEVSKTELLNIRAGATTESEIVGVVQSGTKVMIDETDSSEEFYKVTTESGCSGYCMKKFINLT